MGTRFVAGSHLRLPGLRYDLSGERLFVCEHYKPLSTLRVCRNYGHHTITTTRMTETCKYTPLGISDSGAMQAPMQ